MKEIVHGEIILARHIEKHDIKDGLSFFSKDDEYIQVGSWKYHKDKNLLPHYHNQFAREIDRTYEVLIILNGRLEVSIYTLAQELFSKFIVGAGEILVLLESCHGYKILDDNTTVIEVKNGPYFGADIDRTRIEV